MESLYFELVLMNADISIWLFAANRFGIDAITYVSKVTSLFNSRNFRQWGRKQFGLRQKAEQLIACLQIDSPLWEGGCYAV